MRTKASAANHSRRNHNGTPEVLKLRLYVAGQTPKSLAAITNLKRICGQHLGEHYEIEVIDLLKDPALAQGDQIVAIPTLVRNLPEPIRKIIGDLSNAERVLIGLDVRVEQKSAAKAAKA